MLLNSPTVTLETIGDTYIMLPLFSNVCSYGLFRLCCAATADRQVETREKLFLISHVPSVSSIPVSLYGYEGQLVVVTAIVGFFHLWKWRLI